MKQQLAVYANAVLFTLAALLPIVNPLSSPPIFLSLSADLAPERRTEADRRSEAGRGVGARGAQAQRSQGTWSTAELAASMVGVSLIAVAVFLSYRFSSRLIDYLGETGTAVCFYGCRRSFCCASGSASSGRDSSI